MELTRECRFKNSFIFKYSPRPGTKGDAIYPDDIPLKVKKARNNELLDLQNQISHEDNQAFLGRSVEVLVEGPSKKADLESGPVLQLTGRTPCDRIVVFTGNQRQIGQILPVVIYDANLHTLHGEVEVYDRSRPRSLLARTGAVGVVGWAPYK